MLLLVETLGKLYARLEYLHPNSRPEVLSASLAAFRSEVSGFLNHLLLISDPGSEFFSFPWIFRCFELLPRINEAFAKLVVEIDHPVSKWNDSCVESYLNYSFRLLELLNSINSSVSHLAHARLSLSHALGLWEKNSFPSAIKHLIPVELPESSKVSGFKGSEEEEEESKSLSSEKDKIVHQALRELKGVGFWVCSVVSAVLSGNSKPYLEIKKSVSGLSSSSLVDLDCRISDAILKKNGSVKEVNELNDVVASLASGERSSKAAAEELGRRLEGFQKVLEGLRRGVDNLFSKVLAARNELIDGIRLYKK